MNKTLEQKLKQLPLAPGVYFYKNARGQIIYVGKAAVLKNRVRQYWQAGRPYDAKTTALVAEIHDIDWIETTSEIDALFLEAEHIRRYQPKFNILLRDDKSYVFVRINLKSEHPTVTITRRPLDDKAEYFGPYDGAYAIKSALKYLRRVFPFSTHDRQIPKRACLLYHLGLCPGLEENKISLAEYRANLKKLIRYFKGERVALINAIQKEMKQAAKAKNFEAAAKARDQLRALKRLQQQVIFSNREFLDMSRDHALKELVELVGLKNYPKRLEGFDISHHGGIDTTASMVVFSYGLPDKAAYRKFKLRLPGNDDVGHMFEAVSRRLKPDNLKAWGQPDLLLIDGGKGQVNAALSATQMLGIDIPVIGLAKRFETIIAPQKLEDGSLKMEEINLRPDSHLLKLLQRIRDESHRFAVSYHSALKTKRQTAGVLDTIPSIGPATRKKLLKTFGSLRRLSHSRSEELERAIGPKKAAVLKQYLHLNGKNYDG